MDITDRAGLPAYFPQVVNVYTPVGDGRFSRCTGFVAKPGYVVTAGHCVDHKNPLTLYVVHFFGGLAREYFTLSAAGNPADDADDWAILKGETQEVDPLKFGEMALLHDPGYFVSSNNENGGNDPKARAFPATLINFSPGGLVLNALVIRGDSGSPLFDSAGHVVGIITATRLLFGEKIGYATGVKRFRKKLQGLK